MYFHQLLLFKNRTINRSMQDFILRLSKARSASCLSLLIFLLISAGEAGAQTLNAHVHIASLSAPRVKVEGEFIPGTKVWAFRNTYAGVLGIGERVENLSLRDASGQSLVVRKTAPGEYEANGMATSFSYEVKLEAPAQTTNAAYISWLNNERGFLMLGDLLPLVRDEKSGPHPVTIRFTLPQGWSVFSNEARASATEFAVKDQGSARFFVGRDLRERRVGAASMNFALITSGEWAFTDEEVAEAAGNILKEHARTMGGPPGHSRMTLMLSPYPREMGAGRWSAETRGGSVILLSGRQPSKVTALALLSTPLTHELFHLWVPNGLSLDGNYDWFYEGFTLYQAMRAGMRLGMLSFQDYLQAMGRANDIYLSSSERDRWSLIEASERRWTGATSLVYNKGMLIAFLYDLYLRERSGGKRSLDNVYRELFRLYGRTGIRRDGNNAILSVLGGEREFSDFVRRYIESAAAIDLKSALPVYGLQVMPGGVRTHVQVTDSLNRRQRDLLGQLGYNERVERDGRGARRR